MEDKLAKELKREIILQLTCYLLLGMAIGFALLLFITGFIYDISLTYKAIWYGLSMFIIVTIGIIARIKLKKTGSS